MCSSVIIFHQPKPRYHEVAVEPAPRPFCVYVPENAKRITVTAFGIEALSSNTKSAAGGQRRALF